jgi:small-conductance mechanosensitive channel
VETLHGLTRRVPAPVALWMSKLAIALLVVIATILLARLLDRVLRRLGAARALDPDLTVFLGRVGRVVAITFGLVTALGTVGVQIDALVAGLGLTGFALGFALKDIISNVLAGVLILLYKPFGRGDRIEVAKEAGVVTQIDLRYTTLSRDDGSRVLVPNSTLFTHTIVVRPPPAAP